MDSFFIYSIGLKKAAVVVVNDEKNEELKMWFDSKVI